MSDFKMFSEMTHEEKVEDIKSFVEGDFDSFDSEMEDAYCKCDPDFGLFAGLDSMGRCEVKDVEILEGCGEHIAIVVADLPFADNARLENYPAEMNWHVTTRFYIDMIDEEEGWIEDRYFRDDKGNIDCDKTFLDRH